MLVIVRIILGIGRIVMRLLVLSKSGVFKEEWGMTGRLKRVKLATSGWVLLACGISPMSTMAAHSYSVGVVPQFEVQKIMAVWQPILEEVKALSGVKLNLSLSTNIPEFEQSFKQGEFDFAYMNPYHMLVANETQSYTPILRDVGRQLYGIIVVKKNSPIERVDQLDGKKLVFPAPNALGASLIPRSELSTKYRIDIEPKYVKSHSSVYLNVVLGQAVAGGGVQKTLMQQPEPIRNNLRVIYETEKVAPHPIAVHSRVPQKIREKVYRAFYAMAATEKGQRLLAAIPINQLGDASLNDYEPLKKMGLEIFYDNEASE